MLLLFTKVRKVFSFARNVRERLKTGIKKPEKLIVKKRDQQGLLLQKIGSINALMQQSPNKDFNQKGYFNSHTFQKKIIFSCLFLRFFSYFFLYILLNKLTVLWAIMPHFLRYHIYIVVFIVLCCMYGAENFHIVV